MCGICGIVGPESQNSGSESYVRDMMARLAHRGPDAEGIVVDKDFVFGHRRLSIIDLEFGRQPMQSEDGLITLTYNGEIYNYLELRAELENKGIKFKTTSDTEVLLKLYEIEGEDCVNKLNGMFAFAIYDKRKNVFFAGRDHFGIKPFYYYLMTDGSIVFASEIKALFCHPRIKPETNNDAIFEYLTFQFCLGQTSLFKGVRKLEPGTTLLYQPNSNKKPEIKTYWKESYIIDEYHTEEYFLEQLLSLLQDSTKIQLRSDVALGAYLSGGIDSSIVTTLSANHYGSGFQCFTGKFSEGTQYDESYYARLISDNIQAELHEIIPTQQNFIDSISKLIYYIDEPVAGPGLFPQYLVSKFASEKVKVVLGGQGGDEIFGGYARYLVAYLEQCLKGAIFETQEEGKHIVTLNSIINNLPTLKEYVPMIKSFWNEGLFEPMDRRYFRLIDRSLELNNILTDEAKQKFNKEEMYERFAVLFNSPETKSYVNKMLHFDQKTLLPALLQIEDRVSMAVSLESRVPLLDHRIVNLANSLPPAIKFKDGKLKFVLKESVKNLIPEKVLNRRDKMGFPVPMKEWLENKSFKSFISDILLSKASKERGLFNTESLEKLMNSEQSFGRQLWGALSLELWYRNYIDGEWKNN